MTLSEKLIYVKEQLYKLQQVAGLELLFNQDMLDFDLADFTKQPNFPWKISDLITWLNTIPNTIEDFKTVADSKEIHAEDIPVTHRIINSLYERIWGSKYAYDPNYFQYYKDITPEQIQNLTTFNHLNDICVVYQTVNNRIMFGMYVNGDNDRNYTEFINQPPFTNPITSDTGLKIYYSLRNVVIYSPSNKEFAVTMDFLQWNIIPFKYDILTAGVDPYGSICIVVTDTALTYPIVIIQNPMDERNEYNPTTNPIKYISSIKRNMPVMTTHSFDKVAEFKYLNSRLILELSYKKSADNTITKFYMTNSFINDSLHISSSEELDIRRGSFVISDTITYINLENQLPPNGKANVPFLFIPDMIFLSSTPLLQTQYISNFSNTPEPNENPNVNINSVNNLQNLQIYTEDNFFPYGFLEPNSQQRYLFAYYSREGYSGVCIECGTQQEHMESTTITWPDGTTSQQSIPYSTSKMYKYNLSNTLNNDSPINIIITKQGIYIYTSTDLIGTTFYYNIFGRR